MTWNTGTGQHFIASNPVYDTGQQVYNAKAPATGLKLDGSNEAAAFTTWAATLPAGATIMIPGGSNLGLGASGIVPANIRYIVGSGTITQTAAGVNGLNVSAAGTGVVYGLRIDGPHFAGVAGSALSYSVDNAIFGSGCFHVQVTNCTFTGWRSNGVNLQNGTDCWATDNVMWSVSRGVLFVGIVRGGIGRNVIRDCQLPAATFTIAISIDSTAGTGFAHNESLVISDNIVKTYVPAQAILVHDGARITIEGNILFDVFCGISCNLAVVGDYIADVVIDGNAYWGTVTAGGALPIANAGVQISGNSAGQRCTDMVVTANIVAIFNAVLKHDLHGGIMANLADDVRVEHNLLRNGFGSGVSLGGTNLTQMNVRLNQVSNVQASVSPSGGISTGLYTQNPSTITGRAEGNDIDTVQYGMRFESALGGGFVVGPNNITNVTARYFNPNNAVIQEVFVGTQTLTGTPIAPDLTKGNTILYTLIAALTVNLPTQMNVGQVIQFVFTHDATATVYAITWNAAFKTAWQPTQAANAISGVAFVWDGTNFQQIGNGILVDQNGNVQVVGTFVVAATQGIDTNAAGVLWIGGQSNGAVVNATSVRFGPTAIRFTTATTLDTNVAGALSIGAANANALNLGNGTSLINLAYAVTALGGGAAPTLGTIGGAGPAAAAQNSWLKLNIAGTASFIPVWR